LPEGSPTSGGGITNEPTCICVSDSKLQNKPYLTGDMQITLNNDTTVQEACSIAAQIKKQTKLEFEDIIEMNVIIEPYKTQTN
jgi:divalent metal cation (Fe/Co/Zn/Cd) transporter